MEALCVCITDSRDNRDILGKDSLPWTGYRIKEVTKVKLGEIIQN